MDSIFNGIKNILFNGVSPSATNASIPLSGFIDSVGSKYSSYNDLHYNISKDSTINQNSSIVVSEPNNAICLNDSNDENIPDINYKDSINNKNASIGSESNDLISSSKTNDDDFNAKNNESSSIIEISDLTDSPDDDSNAENNKYFTNKKNPSTAVSESKGSVEPKNSNYNDLQE